MEIRVATSADFDAIAAMLTAAALPALDAMTFRAGDFRVAQSDAAVVIGAIGLETYDADGLLRSLVVAPAARRRGVGDALVGALEERAEVLGLRALLLLTTTAETFFRGRGYATIERAAMPRAIQRSAEFSTLCPASAVCMHKALRSGATS